MNHDPSTNPTDAVADAFAGDATDELLGHSYDGIQEFDNPLPGWWKWLFVATILFAFPYFVYFHGGAEGRTLDDRLAAAQAADAKLRFAEIGELKGDEATLVRYMNEPSWLNIGKSVFRSNCVSCHGAGGIGLVGPNLTDEAFKNVRKIEDVYTVINKGAGGGAMPAWNTRLANNEQVLVAAYVASLRGTDTGNSPRPAEGNAIEPWPEYTPPAEPEAGSESAAEAETTETKL
ncbi:MAG: cbb3-type cytochrome c oxidase N-terminal domain-containing protein [Planctomycetota bacterium]